MDFLGHVSYFETNLLFFSLKVEKNFELFKNWLTSSDPCLEGSSPRSPPLVANRGEKRRRSNFPPARLDQGGLGGTFSPHTPAHIGHLFLRLFDVSDHFESVLK